MIVRLSNEFIWTNQMLTRRYYDFYRSHQAQMNLNSRSHNNKQKLIYLHVFPQSDKATGEKREKKSQRAHENVQKRIILTDLYLFGCRWQMANGISNQIHRTAVSRSTKKTSAIKLINMICLVMKMTQPTSPDSKSTHDTATENC